MWHRCARFLHPSTSALEARRLMHRQEHSQVHSKRRLAEGLKCVAGVLKLVAHLSSCACPEYQTLEQGIAGQTVRPVNPSTRSLAGSVEPGQRGASLEVSAHSAH